MSHGSQRIDGAEQRSQTVRALARAVQHARAALQRRRLQRQLFTGLRHHQQKCRQIAAVDGGHVGGRQHSAGARVIPVVEMALVFGQAFDGVERGVQAVDEVERADEIKLARTRCRQQVQADVGG